MIKIRLVQPDLHRNEIAFRPYWRAKDLFKEVGIEFTTEDSSYDFAFIAQASFIDKQVSLAESVEKGIEFVSKFGKDVFLPDGQDSHSLIGTVEVLQATEVKVLFKNTLLKDLSLYEQGWVNGRTYWGVGDYITLQTSLTMCRVCLAGEII